MPLTILLKLRPILGAGRSGHEPDCNEKYHPTHETSTSWGFAFALRFGADRSAADAEHGQ
jgi:hypothetical protein